MFSHTPDILTLESLVELSAFQQRPCLSIYQHTHRNHPDHVPDATRFAELVKSLAASVQSHTDPTTQAVLNRVATLAKDRHFWAHTMDGLAVLASPACFRVFVLDDVVPELAVLADSFHTKPLRHYLQSVERYQVLALSPKQVQLFEGHRHHLDEVVLSPAVPQTMGKRRAQGSTKDLRAHDIEHFFRLVDQAILEHHTTPSGLPLMLAALPEYHHLFHTISRNPLLMPRGLMQNPTSLSRSELASSAWAIAAPLQLSRQAAWVECYNNAAARGMGSENLSDVAHAAVDGRVASLLIESGLEVSGRIDASTGRIDFAPRSSPRVDDVLDDLADVVEKMGGRVHVLAPSCMPSRSGVAASFRH
jgi:hypothetical protein